VGRIRWGNIFMTSSTVEYFILMIGGPECLVALLEKKCFWSGAQETTRLRSVIACVYDVSIQNQITTTVP
jgi:hypothetical protein